MLLVPAVLVGFAFLCFAPRSQRNAWMMWEYMGFPLVFRLESQWWGEVIFLEASLCANAAVALVTAWLFALAVDRFILRPIRAARMKKHGLREGA